MIYAFIEFFHSAKDDGAVVVSTWNIAPGMIVIWLARFAFVERTLFSPPLIK